jgi:hypothetical protein
MGAGPKTKALTTTLTTTLTTLTTLTTTEPETASALGAACGSQRNSLAQRKQRRMRGIHRWARGQRL